MKLEDFPDEICEWCGGGFETNRTLQRFCCFECRYEAERARYRMPLSPRTCPQCGKPFETTRSLKKYCSDECAVKSQDAFKAAVTTEERRRARAGRVCPHCGITFDANKGDRLYCSRKCTMRAQRDKVRMRKGLAPVAEVRAKLRCQRCGTPMPDARRIDIKRCEPCKRIVHNERSREFKRRQRAAVRASVPMSYPNPKSTKK